MNWKKLLLSLRRRHFVSEGDKSPFQRGEETYDYLSIGLVYELVYSHFTRQRERLNSLDIKAGFALSSSTTLIGAGLALQSLVLHHPYSVCGAYIPEILKTLPLIVRRI